MNAKTIICVGALAYAAIALIGKLSAPAETYVLSMHHDQVGPPKKLCGGWKSLIVQKSHTGQLSVPGWATIESDLPAGHFSLRILKSGRSMGLNGQVAGRSMWGSYTDSNGCRGFFSTEIPQKL